MRNFADDFEDAKQDEAMALEMVSKLEGLEWTPSTPEQDKRGIDAYCTDKRGKRFSVDVKTYAFTHQVIRISGWWKEQQQVVIELTGGPASNTYEGDGAEWILYHWRCLNPYAVGLDETKRLMRKGYITHMWFERAFATWLTQNWQILNVPIRAVKNTQSNGSMLLVGVQDLQQAYQIWQDEYQTHPEAI